MQRKDFLKLAGLAGAASIVPFGSSKAGSEDAAATDACTLVPQETAGPYPLDLHTNAAMIRQDIHETQAGSIYTFTIQIINQATCLGVPNARVDVWHCNAQGNYSGYNTNSGHGNGNVNAVGQTWCRGIQMTDADGYVTFVSIFPGWYTSRVWHIHFQVYINSMSVATSQFTVPVAKKNQIFTSVAPYSAYGADPQAISTDNVFSDGSTLQMATLEDDAATGGYKSAFTAAINTRGLTGLLKMEPETGGQFSLGQNFPNPHEGVTTVPYTLTNVSDVTLTFWDLNGCQVAMIAKQNQAAGSHQIEVSLAGLGLRQGNYLYQLQVANSHGTYRQAKMMTGR